MINSFSFWFKISEFTLGLNSLKSDNILLFSKLRKFQISIKKYY